MHTSALIRPAAWPAVLAMLAIGLSYLPIPGAGLIFRLFMAIAATIAFLQRRSADGLSSTAQPLVFALAVDTLANFTAGALAQGEQREWLLDTSRLLFLACFIAAYARYLRSADARRAVVQLSFGPLLMLSGLLLFIYWRIVGVQIPTADVLREFKFQAAGTSGINPNPLAFAIASLGWLALAALPHRRHRQLLTVALLVVLALSGSRAAALSFVAGLLANVVFSLALRWRARGLLLLCLTGGLVLGGIAVGEQVANSGSSANDVTTGRISMWSAGWAMFIDAPLVGVGVGQVNHQLPRYLPRDERFWALLDLESGGVHNGYIQTLAERGVLGSASRYFIIALLLSLAWRVIRMPHASLIGERALLVRMAPGILMSQVLHGLFEVGGFLGDATAATDFVLFITSTLLIIEIRNTEWQTGKPSITPPLAGRARRDMSLPSSKRSPGLGLTRFS